MTESTCKGTVIGGGGDILSLTTGLFLVLTGDRVYNVQYTKFMCPGR